MPTAPGRGTLARCWRRRQRPSLLGHDRGRGGYLTLGREGGLLLRQRWGLRHLPGFESDHHGKARFAGGWSTACGRIGLPGCVAHAAQRVCSPAHRGRFGVPSCPVSLALTRTRSRTGHATPMAVAVRAEHAPLGAPPHRRRRVQGPVFGAAPVGPRRKASMPNRHGRGAGGTNRKKDTHDFSHHHRRSDKGHPIRGCAPDRAQPRFDAVEQSGCARRRSGQR